MLLSPSYLCQRFVTQQEREWDVEKTFGSQFNNSTLMEMHT